MIILITGGVKSGKSSRALEIVLQEWQFPVSFIATAEVLDEEMKRRITKHQEDRARLAAEKQGFITIEEPLDPGAALGRALPCAVVDCVPMWINNIMHYQREDDFPALLDSFIKNMKNCVIVTNETGLGNIPFDKATRRYNVLLAEANRKIAAAADRVELMVSGIPLRVK
jgi:adenosylcobinamide kinase/adenosylcobinamide-phosphate guanylyltransferase